MRSLAARSPLLTGGLLVLLLGVVPFTLGAGSGPRQGGVLQDAFWEPPRTLDYCKDASLFAAQAWMPIYEGLLSFDYKPGEDFRREMKVVPYLAERWEQPDETTYIFRLRKGVKWHDGKSFTADDVVFSLNYLRDLKNACVKRGNLAGVKSIEKVDDMTVKITTDRPMASLLGNLAQREIVIFPKHVHDAGRLFKDASSVVGTGPMRLKSFDRNDKIVYEAFQHYWGGRPHPFGAESPRHGEGALVRRRQDPAAGGFRDKLLGHSRGRAFEASRVPVAQRQRYRRGQEVVERRGFRRRAHVFHPGGLGVAKSTNSGGRGQADEGYRDHGEA